MAAMTEATGRPKIARASATARAQPVRPGIVPVGADTLPGQSGSAPWRALAHLNDRLLAARSVHEICFIAVNGSWQLLPHRQAVLWRMNSRGKPRLQTISGLAQLTEDSPNTVWLRRLGSFLHRRDPEGRGGPELITSAALPPDLAADWDEFMPPSALVLPMCTPRSGRKLAILALALGAAPSDLERDLVQRAVAGCGHAWAALAGETGRRRPRGGRWRWLGWLLAALAGLALMLPVRLSALAPAEVIALDAVAVTAPMDGVVKSFAVQPNQEVAQDDLLFTLDDTTLRNRREVAQKQLQVARADALAAAQKAFASEASRGELTALNGRVGERQAEVAWLDEQLGRVEVRAPAAGVVVFGDVNDWIGKPLVTGERVALLADPAGAGVLIWLPVADALDIDPGAEVRLFLQVAPLSPMGATLSQTSYQSALSPDGVSSYRLRAVFESLSDEQRKLARIGLKGTAKIYGDRAALGYYLFRRPLSGLREWTGW